MGRFTGELTEGVAVVLPYTAMLSALALAATLAGAQNALMFSSTTIDPSNSGDCKAVADINLDGRADPVLAGFSIAWYESGASFMKHTIRPAAINKEFTTDMQAADVDGDGDIDIIVGDGAGANNILWFENPRLRNGVPGDPRIGADWIVRIIGTQGDTVHDIEVGDMDGDGVLDIVTSGHGITKVWKRTGQTWSFNELSALTGGAGIFLGDINRNGLLDIATPTAWLRNPGALLGSPWTRFPIEQTTHGDECLLVDLNRDGRLDLVTCDAHTRGPVHWFEQPADATSPAWTRRTIDANMASHHPEAADFNNDGRPDLLLAVELGEVAVYLNLPGSPPIFERTTVALSGGHNARIGDCNGDGRPDVFACDYLGNPPATVYLNRFCPANCDASTIVPLLTSNDFTCFLSAFSQGSPFANCDGSTTPPTLNILDFQCFLARFAQGCP